ncbi:MAG: hypothetical protein RLP98_04815 [Devosia sp.]
MVELDSDLGDPTAQQAASWEIDNLTALWEYVEKLGVDENCRAADSYSNFLQQVRALQFLDSWHFPLTMLGRSSMVRRSQLHDDAADRLVYDGYFGRGRIGRMIPWAKGPKWGDSILTRNRTILLQEHPSDPILAGSELSQRPLVLRQLLDHTTFLPWKLDSADANVPTSTSTRSVSIEYKTDTLRVTMPTSSSGTLKIAVAPLAQEKEDVHFDIPADGSRYRVVPNIPSSRIENILKIAIEKEVQYLYLPELTLDEEYVDWLCELTRREIATQTLATGKIPAFRGIFAGVSGNNETSGTNYVIAIDMYGKIIWKQNKLFRWNLSIEQSKRFGLTSEFNSISDPLNEDIIDSSELIVFDSYDLGRAMLFICADISSNSPGDWVMASAGLNWVYAPIMDQSISWEFDTRGMKGPWITRRAHRAAFVSSAQVMVTNSMSLTHRVNETNIRNGDSRVTTGCGIAFCVDTTSSQALYQLINVPLSSSTDVLSVIEWGQGWTNL